LDKTYTINEITDEKVKEIEILTGKIIAILNVSGKFYTS